MTKLLYALAVSLPLACNAAQPSTAQGPATEPSAMADGDRVTLTQGQVGTIEGERIGVSSVFEDDYTLADGSHKKGLTAQLALAGPPEKQVVVGAGSVITVRNVAYEVLSVEEHGGRRSTVTLRKKH